MHSRGAPTGSPLAARVSSSSLPSRSHLTIGSASPAAVASIPSRSHWRPGSKPESGGTITWFDWAVPIALQIFTVFAFGMLMLGIAIAEFSAGD